MLRMLTNFKRPPSRRPLSLAAAYTPSTDIREDCERRLHLSSIDGSPRATQRRVSSSMLALQSESLGFTRRGMSSVASPLDANADKETSSSFDMTHSTGSAEIPVVADAASTPTAGAELGNYPIDLVMRFIDATSAYTGLPYWASVIAITVAIRGALLPVGVMSQRNSSRLAVLQPEMQEVTATMEADDKTTREVKQRRYHDEIQALYRKYDCSAGKGMLQPLLVGPVFISFFMALHRMGDHFPAWSEGGTLWFTDLGSSDPERLMPLMAGLSIMLILELGADGMAVTQNKPGFRAGMRLMALVSIPLMTRLPAGSLLYMITSNLCAAGQALVLKIPSVKKQVGILDPVQKTSLSDDAKLGWLDVLGSSNPVKMYRRVRAARIASAWVEDRSAGAIPISASENRKGAPLPPPPGLNTAKLEAEKAVQAAATPRVPTYRRNVVEKAQCDRRNRKASVGKRRRHAKRNTP